MPVLSLATLAELLFKYGPTALDAVTRYGPAFAAQIEHVYALMRSGKNEVTDADLAQLRALGNKTAADYLAEAGGAPKAS